MKGGDRMMTFTELVALHRALSDRRVLSVYLDGSASDPAIQRSWRLQLDHDLADLRRWLADSPRAEREEFEQCVHRLDIAVAAFTAGIGAPGWAAFITADTVHEAQPLHAPAPTLAAWSTGPCIAPYMRALKEHRPVVVLLADARRTSIYRYHLRKADRVEVIRAHHVLDQPDHMGAPARPGFHIGTRGRVRRDAAQRTLLRGRDQMIDEAANRAHELAGTDGWIVIGGIKRVAARLTELLTPLAPNRVVQVASLDVHASEADIAERARSAASELRDTVDARRIAEIIELAGAQGLGRIGPDEAFAALEHSSVRDLYVTHRFLEDHAAEAERAIRAALDQDASVEEVSGQAAERLNEHGGMAVGLRFRPGPVEAATAGG
jgi:hypothetical protein